MHIRDIDSFDEFKALAEKLGYIGHQYETSWVTGGVTGGSCYDEGSSRHYGREAEDEPEDEYLDVLLEEVCPDLTFLQYRALLKAGLYSYRDSSENEYYGNYTDYRNRKTNLDVLYETLRGFYK